MFLLSAPLLQSPRYVEVEFRGDRRSGGSAARRGAAPPARQRPPGTSSSSPSTPCGRTLRGSPATARSQTPVLDRLAAQGRVFTNAHAHNVVTLPSHTNILTGLYPFQHGVRDNTGFRLAGDSSRPWPPCCTAPATPPAPSWAPFRSTRSSGSTAASTSTTTTTPRGARDRVRAPGAARRRGGAPALAWWRAQAGKPRFLWVHLYDPHAPYEPPEPFASRFKDNPYLGEVAAADSFLAPLLAPFLDGREKPAWSSSPAITARRSASTASRRTASSPTRRRSRCRWSSGGAGSTPGRDGRVGAPRRHLPDRPPGGGGARRRPGRAGRGAPSSRPLPTRGTPTSSPCRPAIRT